MKVSTKNKTDPERKIAYTLDMQNVHTVSWDSLYK